MRNTRTTAVRVIPSVTPMLDLLLVLVIIFMVIAPALAGGFQIDVPTAQHLRAHPEAPSDRTLGIDRDGNYYLNKRPIRSEELEPALKELLRAAPEDRVLYLKAPKALPYGRVLHILNVARENGATVVGLITEERQGSPVNGRGR